MRSKVLLALTVIVFLFMFLMPYYVTSSLPDRSFYGTTYQENKYEESKLIPNQLEVVMPQNSIQTKGENSRQGQLPLAGQNQQ